MDFPKIPQMGMWKVPLKAFQMNFQMVPWKAFQIDILDRNTDVTNMD